jgi:hypothetical protein
VVAHPGTSAAGVYPAILGRAFDALHSHVREAHIAPLYARGTMNVIHGSHGVTRLLVALMGLPAAGTEKAVTLRVTQEVGRDGCLRMHWIREFGTSSLITKQSAQGRLLVERNGLGTVVYALHEQGGSLVYEQQSMRFLNLPLWAGLTPSVSAIASPAADGWDVDVLVRWRGHLICGYAGRMSLVRDEA